MLAWALVNYYRPADTLARFFGRLVAQVQELNNKPMLQADTAAGPTLSRRGQPNGRSSVLA